MQQGSHVFFHVLKTLALRVRHALISLSGIAFSFIAASHSAWAGVIPSFSEVSTQAGIGFQSEHNPMSAGIGWIDYDNDGWMDLFIPNASGHDPYDETLTNIGVTGPNRLYHNNGDGTFTEVGAQAGVQVGDKPSLGVAVGDYNADGYDDLFVTNAGFNTLLRNNKDGTFSDVTVEVGLDDMRKASYAASFGDVDGDGDLDLYVAHWSDTVQQFAPDGTLVPIDNRKKDLYLNEGGSSFTNVSALSGADNAGSSFVSPMTDFDDDGDLDLFAVNDKFTIWLVGVASPNNELLRNDGLDQNGIPQFTPVGAEVGMNQGITGMGIAIGDYDNDGDLDYYRSQYSNGLLSTNDGTGNFGTQQFGSDNTAGAIGVGWGTVFFDANNDGYIDLYRGNSDSANGKIGSAAYQPNTFYLNSGGSLSATDTAGNVGLVSLNAGLGIAVADYDRDGDVDIVVHGLDGSVNLYRNDTSPSNDWLRVALNGDAGNLHGIGAKIRVVSTSATGGSLSQMREIHSGTSHGSVHEFTAHFGFPAGSSIEQLVVEWPNGVVQTLGNIAANQLLELIPPPVITSVNPTMEGGAGTFIYLNGANFCQADCFTANSSETTITLGNATFTPNWVQDNFIWFYVPADATTGPVIVNGPGGSTSTTGNFVVPFPPPVITLVNPMQGGAGAFIYLNGTNFCQADCFTANGSETTITLGNATFTPNWVQGNFIWFYVPAGATTGPVTVNGPGGVGSTGGIFTVF